MSSLLLPNLTLLIDGIWRGSSTGNVVDTVNPATGDAIAAVAAASREDVDAAVVSAHRALADGRWARRPGADRARVLWDASVKLATLEDDMAMLESVDAGKPLAAVKRQDLRAASDCLAYYAGWADKIDGRVVSTRHDALTYVTREPVGVVAAIVPWNFPLMNAIWKVAPALACGCSVVLKPAELTPLSALWLGDILLACGLPPGVLNIVPGLGPVAGQALVEHPLVDKVSFTGSPAVGRNILRATAERVIKVGLELGGKSPCIVFADADLEAAARAVSTGAFFNAGQVCSAATRVLVERCVHDRFVELLCQRTASIRVGDPLDPSTTMGPVISSRQKLSILAAIDAGSREGATMVWRGEIPTGRGFFVAPTIFTDLRADMRIAQDEIFGPVLGVSAFDAQADAVAQANDSRYSLAAAVWTQSAQRAHRVVRQLRAGTVWVNAYGPTDTRLPWGGMGGDSGAGRDLGYGAIDNYTVQKSVWMNMH